VTALDAFVRELRFALRRLAQRPAFTGLAVGSLALGIGATTALYGLVDTLLRRPVAVAEPDRIVTLSYIRPAWRDRPESPAFNFGFAEYAALRRAADPVLAGLAAYGEWSATLNAGSDAVETSVALVNGRYFETLRLAPAAGRLLSPSDDGPIGGNPVAILSDAGWRRRFIADTTVIGRTVQLNGAPFTIVGVAPRGFRGLDLLVDPDFFVPLSMAEVLASPSMNLLGEVDGVRNGSSPTSWLTLVGRLSDGVSGEQAQHVLSTEARAIQLRSLADGALGRSKDAVRRSTLTLLAVALSCLLVACTTVAGLVLTRSEGRTQEMRIRLALGATRRRLAVPLAAESLVVGLAGAAFAVVVAMAVTHALRALELPGGLALSTLGLGLDRRMLAIASALGMSTALLFGLLPALHASRADLRPTTGGTAGASRSVSRHRQLLLAAQLALCVPLLTTSVLLVQSLRQTLAWDFGYDPEGLWTLTLSGNRAARNAATLDTLADRTRAWPGVAGVELVDEGNSSPHLWIDGRDRDLSRQIAHDFVEPAHFEILDLHAVRGRRLGAEDVVGAPRAVVVNESLAALAWPGESPIGRRFAFMPPQRSPLADPVTVVGVVPDASPIRMAQRNMPRLYLSLAQYPEVKPRKLVLRAAGVPDAIRSALVRETRALDADVVADVDHMSDRPRRSAQPQAVAARLVGLFSAIALTLCAVGLYGAVRHSVVRRTPEIGVRVALGAPRGHVVGLVMRQVLPAIVAGLALGLWLSATADTLLQSALYVRAASDPAGTTAAAAILVAVALFACYLPARHAARIDPVSALRHE